MTLMQATTVDYYKDISEQVVTLRNAWEKYVAVMKLSGSVASVEPDFTASDLAEVERVFTKAIDMSIEIPFSAAAMIWAKLHEVKARFENQSLEILVQHFAGEDMPSSNMLNDIDIIIKKLGRLSVIPSTTEPQ